MNKIWISVTTLAIALVPTTSGLPLGEDSTISKQTQVLHSNQHLSTDRTSRSRTTIQLAVNPAINLSTVEQGIIAEMNRARANPPAYSQVLVKWRNRFRGKKVQLKPRLFLQTQEGIPAIDEAIRALKKTRPVSTLKFSRGLTLAARDHVRDQGNRGATGHNGRDGSDPFQRMERYGKWRTIAGENIAYGPDTAQAVVRDLIIDDGVPDRGHRINLFQSRYRVTGVACGPHKRYRVMCSISYAGGYLDRH